MSDEMFIEGKSYLSSKRAAQLSGYAQDYIGQLSRKGLIDAQRIGGLWYIAMDSLEGYQEKAASFKPEPPVTQEQKKEPSTLVFFDGKEYISASRAADMTGYVQDYVGQLARSGQILGRQVGNRWYVEKDSILHHKEEKDGLLAAVQAQAVGLPSMHKEEAKIAPVEVVKTQEPIYTYTSDTADLLPVITSMDNRTIYNTSYESAISEPFDRITPISIRKSPTQKTTPQILPKLQLKSSSEIQKQKIQPIPLLLGAAATIVIVLFMGRASILKENSVYALLPFHFASSESLPASVGEVFGKIGDILEPFIAHELIYHRSDAQ